MLDATVSVVTNFSWASILFIATMFFVDRVLVSCTICCSLVPLFCIGRDIQCSIP